MENKIAMATLGSGCFWCTEAVVRELKGVQSVVAGYAGGTIPHPTYQQVCAGTTGHAEVIQVTFDPSIIPYEKFLEVFFLTHDPTTPNRQGNDMGEQYRSVIFYHSEEQKQQAEKVKKYIADTKAYGERPIVTQIVPYTNFYPAEDYHQEYYQKNSYQPYCQYVIDPKLAKLRASFAPLLKNPAV